MRVRVRIDNQRLTPVAIEPRGVVADFRGASDEVTLYTSTQVPHFVRTFVGVDLRHQRVEGARDRARRRRRLRLEAELLRRGVRGRAGLEADRRGR